MKSFGYFVAAGLLAATAAMATPVLEDVDSDTKSDQSLAASLAFGKNYRGRVLAQGPATHASAGIKFDPFGGLWVAGIFDHTIRRLDKTTGKILEEVAYEQGVRTPDDMAFASNGTMYWSNFASGYVGKRMPDGTTSIIANVGPGADGIAVFPDGRLFVGRFVNGEEIYEVDPQGVNPPRVVAAGFIGGLEAIEAGPDGAIYAASILTDQILRIHRDTGQVSVLLSGVSQPVAHCFDRDGNIYVLEYLSGNIVRQRRGSHRLETIAKASQAADGIAIDAQGKIYVSNWATGSIETILPSGIHLPLVRGGTVIPGGLAVMGQGLNQKIWSAEVSALRSIDPFFGSERKLLPTVFGDPTASLDLPMTVAAHGNHLLVSSWFSNAVQVVNPQTGAVIAAYLDFAAPTNAISFQGDIVVAEAATGSIVRLNPSSGTRVTLASGFSLPAGLATDGQSLWAADWATGDVWTLVEQGAVLPAPVLRATNLSQPEGMAVGRDGTLYVQEVGAQRIVAIAPGGELSIVVSNLPEDLPPEEGLPPSWVWSGIAIDNAGLIYASLPKANRILQIVRY